MLWLFAEFTTMVRAIRSIHIRASLGMFHPNFVRTATLGFGFDGDLYFGDDAVRQLHITRVLAGGLDRTLEVDDMTVERHAESGGDRLGDLRVRHRAEQLASFAALGADDDRPALQLGRDLARFCERFLIALCLGGDACGRL